jgi:hypothetical protein
MKITKSTLMVLATFAGLSYAQAANILTNGGFESRPITPALGPGGPHGDFNNGGYNRNTAIANWDLAEPNSSGDYDIALVSETWMTNAGFNASQLTDTTGLWITSQFGVGAVTATNLSGQSFSIGDQFNFSLDWASVTDDPDKAYDDGQLDFQLVDATGAVLYSETIQSSAATTGGDLNSSSFSYTITGTENGGIIDTSDLGVRLSVIGGDDFFAVDNIQLTAVPEPSSTALLGLGGLALILRRRK